MVKLVGKKSVFNNLMKERGNMNNKLTTPKAILIGSFMIAGTILYTSGNISNPIIRTAHAELSAWDLSGIESRLDSIIEVLNSIYYK